MWVTHREPQLAFVHTCKFRCGHTDSRRNCAANWQEMRLLILAFAAATASAQSCFDQDPYWNEYELDTEMSGATFDHWDFSTTDYNAGAGLPRPHVDCRRRGRGDRRLRDPARRRTRQLPEAAVGAARLEEGLDVPAAHFTHVPMGCGVWPAW